MVLMPRSPPGITSVPSSSAFTSSLEKCWKGNKNPRRMHDWPLKLIAYRLANVRYSDLHRSVHQGEHEHRRDHTFGVRGGVERGGGRSHAQGDGVAFVYEEAPRLDQSAGSVAHHVVCAHSRRRRGWCCCSDSGWRC